MRKKSNLASIFKKLYSILTKKPPLQKMIKDIKMMNFKIHPISGNIEDLRLYNKEFAKLLWYLGKAEEAINEDFDKLTQEDKIIFLQAWENFSSKLQKNFFNTRLNQDRVSFGNILLEIEIFKDNSLVNN
jgi:CRISPR/Cas system-associated protein endoribonuclease Cas2